MYVSRGKDVNPQRSDRPIFTGDVEIYQHINADQSQRIQINIVRFSPGARTRWHYHPYDQGLIIVEGKGIVANEATEYVVEPGDVLLVPANEKHWHGATETTSMAHVGVNGIGENTVLEAVEKIRTQDP